MTHQVFPKQRNRLAMKSQMTPALVRSRFGSGVAGSFLICFGAIAAASAQDHSHATEQAATAQQSVSLP
jgi:hypothetical protein